jgi:hypothetical protein
MINRILIIFGERCQPNFYFKRAPTISAETQRAGGISGESCTQNSLCGESVQSRNPVSG